AKLVCARFSKLQLLPLQISLCFVLLQIDRILSLNFVFTSKLRFCFLCFFVAKLNCTVLQHRRRNLLTCVSYNSSHLFSFSFTLFHSKVSNLQAHSRWLRLPRHRHHCRHRRSGLTAIALRPLASSAPLSPAIAHTPGSRT